MDASSIDFNRYNLHADRYEWEISQPIITASVLNKQFGLDAVDRGILDQLLPVCESAADFFYAAEGYAKDGRFRIAAELLRHLNRFENAALAA